MYLFKPFLSSKRVINDLLLFLSDFYTNQPSLAGSNCRGTSPTLTKHNTVWLLSAKTKLFCSTLRLKPKMETHNALITFELRATTDKDYITRDLCWLPEIQQCGQLVSRSMELQLRKLLLNVIVVIPTRVVESHCSCLS